MEQYVHTILEDIDPDISECKDNYNEALINNKEVQALHYTLEDRKIIDKAKLEEMKKNYDPKSEQIFNSTWDLSDSNEDITIVKNLYKDLSNLNIQDNSESDNSNSSSNKTVIETEKTKKFLTM